MVLWGSLEASVNRDTCKPGKVRGIRELIKGCSRWRHFKLPPCLYDRSMFVPSGCTNKLALNVCLRNFNIILPFSFIVAVLQMSQCKIVTLMFNQLSAGTRIERIRGVPHVPVECQYQLSTPALQHLSLDGVL